MRLCTLYFKTLKPSKPVPGGSSLCDELGIEEVPLISYGDPYALENYKGESDYESLKSFIDGLDKETICSPVTLEACDEESKAKIKELNQLSADELDAKINDLENKKREAKKTFEEAVSKLEDLYIHLDTKSRPEVEDRQSFLTFLKAIQKAKAKLNEPRKRKRRTKMQMQ